MAASVTIEDVAKKAGVSIKTVSRVVNREPNVREKTREKVQQVITELNYRPNQAARGLAGRRSYMIGLLYDSLSTNYLAHLQAGVLPACNEGGYGLALRPTGLHEDGFVEEAMAWINNTQIDGLLITPPLSDSQQLMDAIEKSGVPAIVVSSLGTGTAPAVVIDEKEAARKMALHLASCGHTRIAFVKGHPDHYSSGERLTGFKNGMQEAGLMVERSLIYQGRFDFDSGVEAGAYLLGLENKPTAIFASNDDMAAGVLHAAYARGLSVPADLAVAGFDDTPISRQVWPGITTIRQPIRQIGVYAVETLLAAMKKDAKEQASPGAVIHKLEFELKERGSTRA